MDKMNQAISEPKGQMSPYAPKMVRMKIAVEKNRSPDRPQADGLSAALSKRPGPQSTYRTTARSPSAVSTKR